MFSTLSDRFKRESRTMALLPGVIAVSFFFAVFVTTASAKSEADTDNGLWRIERQWNAADESAYRDFILRLAKSRERTTDRLLKGSGNIYSRQNPKGNIYFYADCADLPYVLRAYFAYTSVRAWILCPRIYTGAAVESVTRQILRAALRTSAARACAIETLERYVDDAFTW